MHEIFMGYVSVSVSAALLTVILLLLAPLYQARFSKRWQYYIWLVVVARFLVPWNPGDGLVGRLFQEGQSAQWLEQGQWLAKQGQAQPAQQNDTVNTVNTVNGGLAAGESSSEPDGADIEREGQLKSGKAGDYAPAVRKAAQGILEHSWKIWILTALALFARKVIVYQCFVKYLKAGCSPVEEICRLEIFGKVIAQSRFTRAAGLYTNSMVTSPLLIGFLHPAVILTKAELSDMDFYYTILHEWTHYRRRDLYYKWLVQLTVCLHWFNPFVYLLEREVSRMCELSCDEAVTKDLDAEGKRAYGDTLLRAAAAVGGFQAFPASVTLHGGKKLMKERLGALMNERKNTAWTAAVSVVSAFLLTAGAVAAGAYRQPAAAQVQTVRQDEYNSWGITKKSDAYYYKGRRIRIFMDVRADASFVRFHFDKDGKVDVKLTRAKDFTITGVSGLTEQETEEILEDYDQAGADDTGEKQEILNPKVAVSRLRIGELEKVVREAVEDCKDGVWYVIKHQGVQYLYYNGVPGKYAFQPKLGKKKALIKIVDLGGTGEEYVLLAVRGKLPLTVKYGGKAVRYQAVSV